jgi:hypothetical protein
MTPLQTMILGTIHVRCLMTIIESMVDHDNVVGGIWKSGGGVHMRNDVETA